MVIEAKKNHPDALVVSHPECPPDVIDVSDKIASTSQMISFARESEAKEFIIVTECGMVEKLKLDVPEKTFYSIGTTCIQMKKNSLEKVYDCLLNETNEITVDTEMAEKAKKALQRMLDV